MTNQEMFDLAVRGLAKQGWERAVVVSADTALGTICAYQAPDGKRCAWGHVDPSLNEGHKGGVQALRENNIGLAAKLTYNETLFAMELQHAHDDGVSPGEMILKLRDVADYFGLVWPADVPQIIKSLEL